MNRLALTMFLMAGVVVFGACSTGCTVVRPVAFVGHESHVTQHPPFCSGSDCHEYGENLVGGGARVHITKHLALDVTDGERVFTGTKEWAGVPKETFDARLTYEF